MAQKIKKFMAIEDAQREELEDFYGRPLEDFKIAVEFETEDDDKDEQ